MESEAPFLERKPPETDLLANYVSRLVHEIDNARWKVRRFFRQAGHVEQWSAGLG